MSLLINKRKHIPSISGLRAVSIILVLFGHAYDTVPFHNRTMDGLMLFVGNAHMGVMTFFVISGYLITYLLRKEWEQVGFINLREFYKRRVLRIFPAFFFYLFVASLLVILGNISTSWTSILSAATFTINYRHLWDSSGFGGEYYWFVGHFWTLSLEEQFYIFWPLTLIIIGLNKGRQVALLLIISIPIMRIVSYFLWPEARGQIGMMLHTAADSLMVGCVVALWEGGAKFEKFARLLDSGIVPMLATFIALIVSPALTFKFKGAYVLSVGITAEAISVAVILLYLTRNPDTQVGRILNSKPVTFVGVISFSLYLWQQMFLTPLNNSWTGLFPLNLVFCFLVAIISYYYIERPILRIKSQHVESRHRKLC